MSELIHKILSSFYRFWNQIVQMVNSETMVNVANEYFKTKTSSKYLHLKNRLLIKCAWTNHVWNWIPFITELVPAKHLLILEKTPPAPEFSSVPNLC